MKKIISVLICFSLVFLCSCSIPKEITQTANINLEFMKDKVIINIDNNDKYIVIQATPYIEDADIYYEEKYETEYDYYVWDIERNRLKSQYSEIVNSDYDNEISDIEISEDNKITLLSYSNAQYSGVYNLSFKKLSSCNDTFESKSNKTYSLMEQSDIIDTERFANYQNLATYTNYINKNMNVFLDDDSTVYIENLDNDYNILYCKDKQLLKNNVNENTGEITYKLTDYLSFSSIQTTVKYNIGCYPAIASISDKYTVIAVSDDMGRCNTLTVWNNSFGTVTKENIEKISATDIDNKISNLEENIRLSYNVDIENCKEYDENSAINSYVYDNNIYKSELLLTMYDFDCCLSTFPKELYGEIISGDASFDKLKFYFIGNFDDEKNSSSVSAYCSNLNDELFIVYSLSAFTYSTFCHELMHAMEYRIWDYEPFFDDEWSSLNPDYFEYTYFDDDKNPYYDNEELQKYFARDYGVNNLLEDRATTFELICDDTRLKENNPWWAENKPFLKKAALLQKVLKESYPSLSDENYGLWSIYNNILTTENTA